MNNIIRSMLLMSVAMPIWASDSILGTPGVDYPNYTKIPETSFDCKQQNSTGYYADPETRNQIYHLCQADGRQDSFLCPIGTVFDQKYFVCNWWHEIKNRTYEP